MGLSPLWSEIAMWSIALEGRKRSRRVFGNHRPRYAARVAVHARLNVQIAIGIALRCRNRPRFNPDDG